MPSRDLVETLRDKRIFLTGGTGFFGKSILDYLLRHPVPELRLRILARNCDTFREQYPELCQVPGLEFFSGDIRNFPFPSGSSDFVIHAATPAVTTLPPGVMRSAPFDSDTLCREAGRADLLVNCTSLGMAGTDGQFEDFSFLDGLRPGALVCDLIYSPPETRLLALAREKGYPTMNGLDMLIHQAILALEQFTQTTIDPQAVLPLVRQALAQAERG